MMTTTSSPAPHNKREFPFEDILFMDSENSYSARAASASTASAMKRVRMLDLSEQQLQQQNHSQQQQQRKRSLASLRQSSSSDHAAAATAAAALVEQVKEEARAQIRNYSSAVENLRQAVEATNADRERLLHDNRILKTGVLKLKSNNDQLQSRCEQTETALHQALQRTKMLESAIIALHASQRVPYGGCGGNNPDQFHDRHVF